MPHDQARVADARSWLERSAEDLRAPGEPDGPSAEEAKGALAVAREVFDSLAARLPVEVRP